MSSILPKTTNRKAIGVILATLIILVASVVLGTGIVLYGSNLYQGAAKSQTIVTTGTQVWIDYSNKSGWAWGASDIRNSGDKLLSVDHIVVRGQAVPFANWYANNTFNGITTNQFQSALVYPSMINANTGVLNNGTQFNASWSMASCPNTSGNNKMIIMVGTAPTCLSQQSGPVSIAPGGKAIIYFKVPQNALIPLDVGSPTDVAIYAQQAGTSVSVIAQAK